MDGDGVRQICDYLGLSYSNEYESTRRGRHISISCPLAPWKHDDADDRNRSCSVKLDDFEPSVVRCWGGLCGYKGTWRGMVERAFYKRGLTEDAKPLLDNLRSVESIDPEDLVKRIRWDEEFEAPQHLTLDVHKLDESELEKFSQNVVPQYAFRRGISRESCKRYGLCYDVDRKRLIFPVRRADGALVGFSGRDVTTRYKDDYDWPKYKNYPGLDKTRFLYGEHLWVPGRPLVFVEGQIDTILTDQCLGSFANVAGVMGEGFEREQLQTVLAAQPESIYFFPDGDAPGLEIMEKIFDVFNQYPHLLCFLMQTPVGHDPADLPCDVVSRLFDNADMILDTPEWEPHRL